MLPACRTADEGFAIPTFDVVPNDVEGFMEELWKFQSTFHDCFTRSEPRVHFFDYMVGQFSKLERKSIEPMALQVGSPPSGLRPQAWRTTGCYCTCTVMGTSLAP